MATDGARVPHRIAPPQVQDAGLIFLSKIASDIAEAMRHEPPEAMLATVLVTLSLSTALLGLALIITGKLQLAALVQYLPLPVVGGYLAFIGLYCLEAGLSLMTGLQVDSLLGPRAFEQWHALLQPRPLYFCLPGVLLGGHDGAQGTERAPSASRARPERDVDGACA